MGDDGADVGILRPPSENQCCGVRGVINLAQLPVDECDKSYRLYKNERQLPPLKSLPSETFFEHCMTGFEGDEAPPARLPEFYERHLVLVVRRLSP